MRWSALLLVFACAWAQAAGSLLIIGGALRDSNSAVWDAVVSQAGGRGARVAVFPTASADPQGAGAAAAARLRAAGAEAFVVPVAPRLPGDARQAADDAALAARVAAAGGAYFVGGDQNRIVQALRHADGSATRVLDAVWRLYQRGGVVAGSSAGAAIMSRTMFTEPRGLLAMLGEGAKVGADIGPGLGFIGEQVFIDQHFLVRGRVARLIPAMLASGQRIGVGIDEDTAMLVQDGQARVLGYKGVLRVDLSEAMAAGGGALRQARLSYYESGDGFDLLTGAITSAAHPLEHGQPTHTGRLFSSAILANGALTELMAALADSDQDSATGLAFEAGVARGFLFTLRRLPTTRAYARPGADSGSVLNIGLDIQPVRMADPLYRDEPQKMGSDPIFPSR
ncbi:cyanophycinase [Massilia sp. TS11]|uniref:cyanophycinase n=1 Tax=Massilia sp. TS11 TaxID=2908003 RepID=UPI001EDA9EB2|nr:cyanophycinase [Massilia sp. TS11]MCG2586220.1 cyanophycinase [Massilia sp. TS11]